MLTMSYSLDMRLPVWERTGGPARYLKVSVAVQTCTDQKSDHFKPDLKGLEVFTKRQMVAHTGYAREGSPMFADVLRVLHSWIWRSLRTVNVRCFSPALLY